MGVVDQPHGIFVKHVGSVRLRRTSPVLKVGLIGYPVSTGSALLASR